MALTSQTISTTIERVSVMTDRRILPGIRRNAFQHSFASHVFLGEGLDEQFGMVRMQAEGRRTQTGGRQVQIQHEFAKNSTAKRMAGNWDTYDTTPQDLWRRSIANWKRYSATQVLNDVEQLYNTGDAALASEMETTARSTMSSLVDLIMEDLLDGTAVPADGVTSFNELAGANDSVQGISGANYGQWNSYGVSGRGTAAGSVSFASGSFAGQGIADLRAAHLSCSQGRIKPNLHLTTDDVFSFYEGQIVPAERYTAPVSAGDAGVMSLAFKQSPVLNDPYVASGEWLMVNTDAAYVMMLDGADLQPQEWKPAAQQSARAREFTAVLQLVVEDRRYINKLTSFTA